MTEDCPSRWGRSLERTPPLLCSRCTQYERERDEARRVAAAFEQSLVKMKQERDKYKEKLHALDQHGSQARPQAPVKDQVYQSGLHDAGVVLVTQEPVDLEGAVERKGPPAPEEPLVQADEGSLPVADDKKLEARLESAQAYRGACERLYKRHLADLEAARRLCEGTGIMLNRAQGSVLAFEDETSRRRGEGFSRRSKEQ